MILKSTSYDEIKIGDVLCFDVERIVFDLHNGKCLHFLEPGQEILLLEKYLCMSIKVIVCGCDTVGIVSWPVGCLSYVY